MKHDDVLQWLIFALLCVAPSARKRDCTMSGHICKSALPGVADPCKDHPLEEVCELSWLDGRNNGFKNRRCDYCPEMHDAAEFGASYRQNETACRQEDGFYQCKLGGLEDNCVHRTWTKQFHVCRHYEEMYTTRMNCTDDEMTCKTLGPCVKRFYINSDYHCFEELRTFYLSCHDDEFQCETSRKCLPREWVRDGSVDCSVVGKVNDTSDEDQPLTSCNPQTEFKCQDENSRCIPREMVMDGRKNCPDASDEKQELECHNLTEFRCELHGRCIRRYRVNDGFPDCPKGTDENLSNFQCFNLTEFDCGNGRCIPRSWVGNSLTDCVSGIDEIAKLDNCLKDEFMCRDGSRCLPMKYLCDGIQNCADCSDEMELCDEPLRFRCKDEPASCIPWTRTCDNMKDCMDGSDENTHTIQGFKCKNNLNTCYVPQFLLKNNVSMCTDSSDICFDKFGNFLCARCINDRRIIAKHQICDGIIDCLDLSDECLCQDSKVNDLCDTVFNSLNNKLGTNLTIIRDKAQSVCNGLTEWVNKLDEKFCIDEQQNKQIQVTNNATVDYYHCQEIPQVAMEVARKIGVYHFIEKLATHKAIKCDGRIECTYYDDECSDDCPQQPDFCHTTEWKVFGISPDVDLEVRTCPNATTMWGIIVPTFLCDGLQHCEGGEDEDNCADRIYCDAGFGVSELVGVKPVVSIKKEQQCDLTADCIDSRDEVNCSSKTHFYCKGNEPLYIERKKVLDGHADCKDYSDECPIELFAKNMFSSPTELLSNVVLKSFIWIVAITSFIGNFWVLTTTVRELVTMKDKNTPGGCTRLFIANLAIADLLTGTCLWILIVKSAQFSGKYCLHDVDWRLSATCDMIGVLLVISSETSLNMIIALTGLRLYSVIKVFQSKKINHKYCCYIAMLAWLLPVITAFYPIWQTKSFASITKITQNEFFSHTVINREDLEKYFERAALISTLGSNNSSIFAFSNNYLTSKAAKTLFPQRYVHIEGVFGYYGSNSVCFPDHFTANNNFSLAVMIYNTLAILFLVVSYIIFYKRATSKIVATNSTTHWSDKMKNRITVIVLTSAACWIPICIMTFYAHSVHTKNSLPEVTYIVAAVVLLPIDSCFNPLLYSEVHVKLYNAVRNMWQKVHKINLTGEINLGVSYNLSEVTTWRRTNLAETNLVETNLAETNLAETNLAETNLAETNLAETNLAET